MTEFHLTIKLGNDAMQDPYNVAKALREVAARQDSNWPNGTIWDVNGNPVGSWVYR